MVSDNVLHALEGVHLGLCLEHFVRAEWHRVVRSANVQAADDDSMTLLDQDFDASRILALYCSAMDVPVSGQDPETAEKFMEFVGRVIGRDLEDAGVRMIHMPKNDPTTWEFGFLER